MSIANRLTAWSCPPIILARERVLGGNKQPSTGAMPEMFCGQGPCGRIGNGMVLVAVSDKRQRSDVTVQTIGGGHSSAMRG